MMPYYVEVLRALRAMRIVGVVLVLVVLGAVWLSVSFPLSAPTSRDDLYGQMEHSPTAHVTRSRLPHGGTRTVVDDPNRQLYAVIDRDAHHDVKSSITARSKADLDRGHGGATLVARTRPSRAPGDVGYSFTVVHYAAAFALAIPCGLLMATLLAGPFAKENNGHLELALTRPYGRELFAVSVMLVDVAAIIVAQIVVGVAALALGLLWSPHVVLAFNREDAEVIGLALMTAIAWYACLTAFSTSFKRGPGAVLGIGWVVAMVVPIVAVTGHDATTPIGRAIHAALGTMSYADPIAYLWFNNNALWEHPVNLPASVAALGALALVYGAAALVQWQRVEA